MDGEGGEVVTYTYEEALEEYPVISPAEGSMMAFKLSHAIRFPAGVTGEAETTVGGGIVKCCGLPILRWHSSASFSLN